MKRPALLTLTVIITFTMVLLDPVPPAQAGIDAPSGVVQPVALQGAPVASPQAAVGEAVQTENAAYSGDCVNAVSPQDVGKLCSKFVAQSGDLRAYLVGRTFSEFGQWVFIRQSAGGWQPLAAVPFDGSASAQQIPWPP
jgi:hypothetical protein